MDEKRKDKHKPSSAYQVERQGSHGIVYSNLNKSGPGIYQNGKIMFHRNLTYGDGSDSDHDNICAEIQTEGELGRKTPGNQGNRKATVSMERGRNDRVGRMARTHP